MKNLPKGYLNDLKKGIEETVSQHLGLGMSIRNEWGLWSDSTLSKWFNERGIFHPDDMSGIILDSLVATLKGEPINLEEQIKEYQDYWAKMKNNPKQFTILAEKGKKPKIL